MIYILLLITSYLIITLNISRVSTNKNSYPIEDFGFMLSIILGFYVIIPSIAYLFLSENLILLGSRISNINPSNSDVIKILLLANAFIFGIYLSYKFNKKQYILKQKIITIDRNIFIVSSLILIVTFLIISLFNYAFGLTNFESYDESYTKFASIPLIYRQSFLVVESFFSFTKVIVLIALFQRWKKYKKWIGLYLFFFLFSFDSGGARTSLVINFLLVIILYQIFVAELSRIKFIILSLSGLIIFSILGAIRGGNEVVLSANIFLVGELLSVWGNSLHILNLQNEGNLSVPWQLFPSELFSFIPRQLLPFEKLSYSYWYVKTFYSGFFDSGGGLGFGLISQFIIFGGIIPAFTIGYLWGKISLFFKKWLNYTKKWWVFPIYVTVFLVLYIVPRTSSFEILTAPILKFILIIIIINGVNLILKRI